MLSFSLEKAINAPVVCFWDSMPNEPFQDLVLKL